MKKIQVRYYAILREQAGKTEEALTTSAGSPAALFVSMLCTVADISLPPAKFLSVPFGLCASESCGPLDVSGFARLGHHMVARDHAAISGPRSERVVSRHRQPPPVVLLRAARKSFNGRARKKKRRG